MRQVLKACPCVVVNNRVLAFKHPDSSFQLPKGTVEDEESIEEAVSRELWEESGISTSKIICKIGEMDWYVEAGTTTYTVGEHQQWHIYLMDPGTALPETWEHAAIGSDVEEGQIFKYFWQSLDNIPDDFHPVYREVLVLVTEHLQRNNA